MAKRYVDCSLDIVNSDSWVQFPRKIVKGAPEPSIKVETLSTVKDHKCFVQSLHLTTQCFTHIDAPIHFFEDGISIDQVPLNQFINSAVVIDMMHKKPSEGVTGEDLENSGVDVREGDTIIIRTGWTDRAFGTREFWANMIYLDPTGADWIVSKKPRALMQDYMTDIPPVVSCDHCGQLLPQNEYCPNHFKFLGDAGMILIEWCANLKEIVNERVEVIALPLKIKGADGSPARVIVIDGDD